MERVNWFTIIGLSGIAFAGIISFIMDITNIPHIPAFWDILTVWILMTILYELIVKWRKRE